MSERDAIAFPDRARFMAYAARAMRGLIIDYARSRHAQKRGGQFEITALDTDICRRDGGPRSSFPRSATRSTSSPSSSPISRRSSISSSSAVFRSRRSRRCAASRSAPCSATGRRRASICIAACARIRSSRDRGRVGFSRPDSDIQVFEAEDAGVDIDHATLAAAEPAARRALDLPAGRARRSGSRAARRRSGAGRRDRGAARRRARGRRRGLPRARRPKARSGRRSPARRSAPTRSKRRSATAAWAASGSPAAATAATRARSRSSSSTPRWSAAPARSASGAKAASSRASPIRNIARLIDAGVSGTGQPYLVLELVDGERIDQLLRRRALRRRGAARALSRCARRRRARARQPDRASRPQAVERAGDERRRR